ncbi:MAG: sulfatase-like hydrolase/transferase [Isosphaeraceae bacterium]
MSASINRVRLAVLSLALAGVVPIAASADDAARPNVLFLLTDDQRADTIHALGNPAIQTPHLDQLANTGFAFRNAYCMGGDRPAVCLPSRTMILSGRSLFHLRTLKADSPSLPKSMNAAGYQTYYHGKKSNTPHQIHKSFEQSHYLKDDERERTSGHPGREIADDAIRFLHESNDQRPFFMLLAFGNPHDPRVPSDQARRHYDEPTLPLPKNFLPLHPFNNGEMTIRDETLAPWPRTPEVVRKHLTDYYAVITQLDAEIGRVLQTLRDQGKYEKTIIVFASDHGLAVGSHGLMGKQNLYEDGMKAPLIFAGPGVPHGQSDALVYLHDLFPTFCDLVNTPVPPGLDGKSFAPILRGEKQPSVRDSVFLAYRSVQRAIRVGDWKLIRYPKINKSQLFNVKADPNETWDLADNPSQAARIKELTALLKASQDAEGDPLPLTSQHPTPASIDTQTLQRMAK